jgi:putative ABC transport system permease protein
MRYAIRSLWKAKTFSLVSIVTLAIGIGATTAVFSVVDAVLLRDLPFKDAGRIMTLAGANAKRGVTGASFSYPSFVDLAARDRMFSGLTAFASERFNISGVERPEQLAGARVSAGFFGVLGIDPAIGRAFAPDEDTPGGRAREIGVRVALGADPRSVIRLVDGEGLRLTAAGIAIGTGASVLISRAMRSLLFGVSPADPLTYVVVVALFALVAPAACLVPARRALRVDPLVTLRAD